MFHVKHLVQALAVVAILVLAQMVGGAVAWFLGTEVLRTEGAEEVLVWIIIMAVAVWCAVCFIHGALAQARRWIR